MKVILAIVASWYDDFRISIEGGIVSGRRSNGFPRYLPMWYSAAVAGTGNCISCIILNIVYQIYPSPFNGADTRFAPTFSNLKNAFLL